MAKKNNNQTEDKNIRAFADILIEKMEQIHNEWEKPWIYTNTNMLPRNISGHEYSGMNAVMLMFNQEKYQYSMPIYMTFHQATQYGVSVKKGEKGMPVVYSNLIFINKETGEKITNEEYKDLTNEEKEKYFVNMYTKYFTVFNIDQTTFAEVQKDKYESLKNEALKSPMSQDENEMMRVPELDLLITKQAWRCPIKLRMNDSAFYSPSADEIVLPMKIQFQKGEHFYGTMLHEMTHSTGEKLERDLANSFGSEGYAREELVAELTSAFLTNRMGFGKQIESNNIAYLNSWIKVLKEDPSFIMKILADVNKAAEMIQTEVDKMKRLVRDEHLENIRKFMEERDNAPKVSTRNITRQEAVNEKIYYSSVAYLQFSEDTQHLDSHKENGQYEDLLTEAIEYDNGEAIDLSETWEKAEKNAGDDLLIENEHYAVVYNNSVGGTYDIMRKQTESEVWDMIIRYGMPPYPNEDIQKLAEKKMIEETANIKETDVLEMPNGRKLHISFDSEKKCLNIGEMIGGKVEPEYIFPYTLGNPLGQILDEIKSSLVNMKENKVSNLMNEASYQVDEMAMMAAMNMGINVSLRDFAKGLPPTQRRIAIGVAGAVMNADNKQALKDILKVNNYAINRIKIDAIWKIGQEFKNNILTADKMVNILETLEYSAISKKKDEEIEDGKIIIEDAPRSSTESIVSLQESIVEKLNSGKMDVREASIKLFNTGHFSYIPDITQTRKYLADYSKPQDMENWRDYLALKRITNYFDNLLAGKSNGDKVEDLVKLLSDDELQEAKKYSERRKGRSDITKTKIIVAKKHISNEIEQREANKNPEKNMSNEKEKKEKELHLAYLGNGITICEKGDRDYTGHISPDRKVSLYKKFTEDNMVRIKDLAEKGNMLIDNCLVLNPLNKPSKVLENSVTGERYLLSVENINGETYACHGKQVMKKGDQVDLLMDLDDNNIALLDAKAEKILQEKKDNLIEAYKTGDNKLIDEAKYGYLWAARYKAKDKYVYSDAMRQIEDIKNSVNKSINNNQKKDEDVMENKINESQPDKMVIKDDVNVFKMKNGFFGINKVENGERSSTYKLSGEDVKAFFESTKGQSKEVRDKIANELFVKYQLGHENKGEKEVQIMPLKKVDDNVRQRITDAKVFKMKDGYSYAVKASIDNEPQMAVRVNKQDVAAFFDGYKGMSKEEQQMRKEDLAGKYFASSLEMNNERKMGMGR